jgi:hypothetical protein
MPDPCLASAVGSDRLPNNHSHNYIIDVRFVRSIFEAYHFTHLLLVRRAAYTRYHGTTVIVSIHH